VNTVDGEITVPVFPAPRTDQDIRAIALNAAVQLGQGRASREWTLDVAKDFETYLRNGAA
jgi:hypothetical protein